MCYACNGSLRCGRKSCLKLEKVANSFDPLCCTKCGNRLSPNDEVCPQCGAVALGAVPPPGMRFAIKLDHEKDKET